MFIKNITEPLQHMIQLSEKISSGDLSQTIRIEANNELADLGNVINEMSSNLQEIMLLSQRVCTGGKHYIREVLGYLNDEPLTQENSRRMQETVKKIGDDLVMLEEVIAYFNFYSVDRKSHDR
jgi:methyl-accepting chemotaxis protein